MAQQRIVVVGGGVMGLAAGCALAAQPEIEVTVLERFQVGHDWASSHGLTRAIRHEYGAETIYTEMVARSLPLWEALARETGRTLYTETGVLTLGHADDGHTLPGLDVMRAARLASPTVDRRESATNASRSFGQTSTTRSPGIPGGMLHASECLPRSPSGCERVAVSSAKARR